MSTAWGVTRCLAIRAALTLVAGTLLQEPAAFAHPLGNFSINHYTAIRVAADRVTIRYVVDMAEIATFQEITTATGRATTSWSDAERAAYLERTSRRLVDGLRLAIEGAPIPLRVLATSLETAEGAGGQPTLRLGIDAGGSYETGRDEVHFLFHDTNHPGRAGWHELVVRADTGVEIFDSSAYTDDLSDELRQYPRDDVMAPLQERTATWSLTAGGLPAGARRAAGRPEVPNRARTPRDRVAMLLATPVFSREAALMGLLLAFVFGAVEGLEVAAAPRLRPTTAPTLTHALRTTVSELATVMPYALVALIGATYLLPSGIAPHVTALSGAAVALLGISSLRGSAGARPPSIPGTTVLAIALAGVASHAVEYGMVLLAIYGSGLLVALLLHVDGARERAPLAARRALRTRALLILAVGSAIAVSALTRFDCPLADLAPMAEPFRNR